MLHKDNEKSNDSTELNFGRDNITTIQKAMVVIAWVFTSFHSEQSS